MKNTTESLMSDVCRLHGQKMYVAGGGRAHDDGEVVTDAVRRRQRNPPLPPLLPKRHRHRCVAWVLLVNDAGQYQALRGKAPMPAEEPKQCPSAMSRYVCNGAAMLTIKALLCRPRCVWRRWTVDAVEQAERSEEVCQQAMTATSD